jgi:hypothetical protein
MKTPPLMENILLGIVFYSFCVTLAFFVYFLRLWGEETFVLLIKTELDFRQNMRRRVDS